MQKSCLAFRYLCALTFSRWVRKYQADLTVFKRSVLFKINQRFKLLYLTNTFINHYIFKINISKRFSNYLVHKLQLEDLLAQYTMFYVITL